LGKRIRNAKLDKVPYFVVLGDQELNAGTITLEKRDGTKVTCTVDEAVEKLTQEIAERSI
jgi:threonyl-tRNA synthetase